MKRVCLSVFAALLFSLRMAAGGAEPEVLSIACTRDHGVVAAAYRGGQVVVWDFETAAVQKIFNASSPKDTLNLPLVHFNPVGRLAFTQEGDSGLISAKPDGSAAAVIVPRRLLVKGITAFSWSQKTDAMLVAIGRDIFLIGGQGHLQWQRRLETRAIITDVVWHPSEQFYTAATDQGEVSTWETGSGRLVGSSRLAIGEHPTVAQVGWTNEDWLVASVHGVSFAVLDPETLKPKKTTACNCLDFAWMPGKEIFVSTPPGIAVFSESGQRTREIRTSYAAGGPIVWAGDGRLLTASADGAVVLRDTRAGKVLRTFVP